jgi:hypothetical protein
LRTRWDIRQILRNHLRVEHVITLTPNPDILGCDRSLDADCCYWVLESSSLHPDCGKNPIRKRVVHLWRPLLLGYQRGAGKIRTTRPGDPALRPNGLGEGMRPGSKLGVIHYLLAGVVTWRSGARDL